MQRRRRSWQLSPWRRDPGRGQCCAAPRRRLDRLRPHDRTTGTRRSRRSRRTTSRSSAARTRSTSRKIDPSARIGQQSYPVAIDGKLYVTTNDDNVFAIDGATGKVWQFKAEQRPVQELRHRREPRPRLLRRQALPAHARHAPEQAEPRERRAPRPGRDRPGGARRRLELRLLRDERADLRQPPRDRRRRRLRVRRARLRDGVHDRPHAGLAESRSGRSRPRERAGAG